MMCGDILFSVCLRFSVFFAVVYRRLRRRDEVQNNNDYAVCDGVGLERRLCVV